MTNKSAHHAIDMMTVGVSVPVEIYVRAKKCARQRNTPLSRYITAVLYAHTHEDPWTDEDEKMRQDIVRKTAARKKSVASKKRGK